MTARALGTYDGGIPEPYTYSCYGKQCPWPGSSCPSSSLPRLARNKPGCYMQCQPWTLLREPVTDTTGTSPIRHASQLQPAAGSWAYPLPPRAVVGDPRLWQHLRHQ
ncbi:uncharacterized protein UV8b_00017 [Ustilaginoidea virens]|uniref:Uncharacterized protein n=1 Tax=Ustilaginoidea virens TaxID=1159556 RepID=A0A8E5HI11_USTVR|nr:uncharacterized protein UV8b_00017 [Ustilaginoidea virens]QUC15776.1 hypothetical protein UV8b_00017 [Ustilaginoidea virens]